MELHQTEELEVKHVVRNEAPMGYRNASFGSESLTPSKFAIALSKSQALLVKQSTA